jgi:hypothetical protein
VRPIGRRRRLVWMREREEVGSAWSIEAQLC